MLSNRQQNAENKTESASKRVFAPVFFFCIFNIHSCTEKMNENLKNSPDGNPFENNNAHLRRRYGYEEKRKV